MVDIAVKQGYDLRIRGKPRQEIVAARFPTTVGIRPDEFRGIKPVVLVEAGDVVQTGTPLLADKDRPEIVVVSPATGKVEQVRRGERRALLEIRIAVDSGSDSFAPLDLPDVRDADRTELVEGLCKGGLWPLLRQQPFDRIPDPRSVPKGIFLSGAADDPFAAEPNVVLAGEESAFQLGIDVLGRLTSGKVHLTLPVNLSAPCPALAKATHVERHTVSGPYPSGSPAVHAFFVDRLRPGETIWTLGVQDVLAVGRLFLERRFPAERIVALAGNGVIESERKLYRTRFGAVASSLVDGKLEVGEQRLISGGVLRGERIASDGFVGLRDTILTVLPEGRQRELLGWLSPGRNKYSWSRAFLSALAPKEEEFDADTNQHGDLRACIQSTYCLKVCPTDVQPLFVWKAVSYGDLEEADQFGITDCVGCGLCTFVCPSKIDIDGILRQGLDRLEKEG